MLVSASAGASASVEEGLRETRVEDLEFLGASVPRESREMGWKSASSLTLLRCCFAAVAAAAANDGAEAFEADERRRPRPPSYAVWYEDDRTGVGLAGEAGIRGSG